MSLLSILLMTICGSIVSAQFDSVANSTYLKGFTEGPASNIFDEYMFSDLGVHKIHDSRASWNAARNICLDEKAQLVVIESAAEEAMLLRHMKTNNMRSIWIGVHDMFEKKQWTTIKGDRLHSLDYVHWGRGEPNGLGAGEHCVEMNLGGMNDLACETEMGFVCERSGIDIRIMRS